MIAAPPFPVWRTFRRHPRRTLTIVALMVVAGAAEGIGILSLLPMLEMAGDGGTSSSDVGKAATGALRALGVTPSIGALFTVIAFALMAKAGIRWLAMAQVGAAVAEVGAELRGRLLRAILTRPWSEVTSEPIGRVASSLSRDAFWGASAYRAACGVVAAGTQLIIYFVAVLLVSWRLGLLAALVGGIVGVPIMLFIRRGRRLATSQTTLASGLVARSVDVITALKPIRAMGREEVYLARLGDEIEALREAEERHVKTAEGMRALLEPLLAVAVLIALLVLLASGADGLPTIAVLAVLLQRMAGRFQLLQTELHETVAAGTAWRAVEAQIAAIEDSPDPRWGTLPAPAVDTGIEIDRLSFAHGPRLVLDGLSLSIPAGSFVAIMGPSGAGKTTLLDHLAGLRTAKHGEIRIDGIPLWSLDASGWRSIVGYVPQESVLLNASILENVLLGAPPEFGADEAIRALREAGAAPLLAGLAEGLSAQVGERGLRLSGGERRRIALARALLTGPRLLILDEATAELDDESAIAIGSALRSLRGRMTIIAATHHLELAAQADEVWSLEGGRLASLTPRRVSEWPAGLARPGQTEPAGAR